MEQKDYTKAKELFYRCRGDIRIIDDLGEWGYYCSFDVPRALERTWRADMRAKAFYALQSATEPSQMLDAFRSYGRFSFSLLDTEGLYTLIEWVENHAASSDTETVLRMAQIAMELARAMDAHEHFRLIIFRANPICKMRLRLRGSQSLPPRYKNPAKTVFLRYVPIAAQRLAAVLQQLDATAVPHRVAKELNDTLARYKSMRYVCPKEFRW